MLYDKYKKKMFSIARLWALIKRYRVMIASIIFVMVATTTTLLATSGVVVGVSASSLEVVYGEQIDFKANAFMSDVAYEHYIGGEWKTGFPKEVGNYKVRAVSSSAFGGKRYSEECSLTIKPRDVVFMVADSTLAYGDKPVISIAEGGRTLAVDDSVTCSVFDYKIEDEKTSIAPVVAGVKITNIVGGEGKDVTHCYNINVKYRDVELTKRKITIETENDSRPYNGTPFTSEKYKISEGSVADGDKLVLDFEGSITNVGSTRNYLSVEKILNSINQDVTDCYEITVKNRGMLTVEKREVLINSENSTKVYNGNAHTYDGFTVNDKTPVVANQSLTIDAITGVNAGKYLYKDAFNWSVVSNGVDVSENYDVKLAEENYLEIQKRTIKVELLDREWVYDGENHYDDTAYNSSHLYVNETEGFYDLLSSHSLVTDVENSKKIKNVSENQAKNSVVKFLIKENGIYVSENYKIETTEATLTIKKRTIKVELLDREWVYDGENHYDDTAYNSSHLYVNETEGFYDLLSSHSLVTDVENSKKIKNVSENQAKNSVVKFLIKENGIDVSENYKIETTEATLTIQKRTIKIELLDREWVYDGENHYDDTVYGNENLYVDENAGFYPILENLGHKLTTLTYTEVCNIADSGVDNNILTFTITGEEDVANNYDIVEVVKGNLTIKVRNLRVLKTKDLGWVYDKQAHVDQTEYTNDNLYVNEAEGFYNLVKDHKLNILTSTSVQLVAHTGTANRLTFNVLYGDGTINENYLVTVLEYGELAIYHRTIYVRETDSISHLYDGKSFKDSKIYGETDLVVDELNGKYSLLPYDKIKAIYRTEITNVLETIEGNNVIEFIVTDANDVYDENYIVDVEKYGTLTIIARTLVVKETHSYTWVYDASFHMDGESGTYPYTDADLLAVENQSYFLVEGHKLLVKIDTATKVKVVSDTKNNNNVIEFIVEGVVNGETVDLTSNYDISVLLYGTLTISPRKILLESGSYNEVYDGEEHSNESHSVLFNQSLKDQGYYSLVSGHTTTVTEKTVVKFYNGEGVENKIKIKIKEGDSDVTENYTIVPKNGTLKVGKRAVTIRSDNGEWVYDGLDHVQTTITDLGSPYHIPNTDTFVVLSSTAVNTVTNGTSNVINDYAIKNNFGAPNEEDATLSYVVTIKNDGILKITLREITITARSAEKVYDGIELKEAGYDIVLNSVSDVKDPIPTWHTISVSMTADSVRTNVGETANKIDEFALNIVANNNVSVKYNYKITYIDGTLKITPREITIIADSDKKIYDGTPLTDSGYTIKLNSVSAVTNPIPSGEEISLSMTADSTITNVGETDNKVDVSTIKITIKGSNIPTIGNYSITCEHGVLTITPRQIKVISEGQTFRYDGTWHHWEGYLIVDDADNPNDYLAPGQYSEFDADYDYTKVKEVTDKEGVPNDIRIKIYKGAEETTSNYQIDYSEKGKLIVKHWLEITISTGSAEQVYNGMPLTNDWYEVEGLLSIHDIEVKVTGTITNVGEVQNTYTCVITDENGIEITSSYIINDNLGTLKVTPRYITIIANSDSKVYDGMPLTNQGFTVELVSPDDGYGVLVSGHRVVLSMTEDSIITNVGKKANVIEQTSVQILNTYQKDVKENYNITYVDGILEVTPCYITIKPNDFKKVYDGTPLKNTENLYEVIEGNLSVVDTLKIVTSAEITNAGSIEYAIDSYTIERDGKDVSGNYVVKLEKGTLTVERRKVTVETATDEWYYDGYEKSNTNCSAKDPTNKDDGLVQNHYVLRDQTKPYTIVTNVKRDANGDVTYYENVLEVIIYDADNNPVTSNYDINYKYGELTVKARPVIIISYSATDMYDGEALTQNGYDILSGLEGEEALAYCDKEIITFTGSQINVGSSENIYSTKIVRIANEEDDVTYNYELDERYGTLTVTQRPITVQTGTKTLIYNGLEQDYSYAEWIGGEKLVLDHQVGVATKYYAINVGSYENKLVATILSGTTDVGYNYKITHVYGNLQIEKRSVILVAGSDSKEYDGTPLTNNDIIVKWAYPDQPEKVIEGVEAKISHHDITAEFNGSITIPGSVDNVIVSGSVVITEGDVDVTENYDIVRLDNGTLTITARKIIVKAQDEKKDYDGTPLNSKTILVVDDTSLIQGHSISGTINGSQTQPGWSDCEIAVGSVKIIDEVGQDVTSYYEIIEYQKGELLVQIRIELTSESAEKQYDGTPLTRPNVSISYGLYGRMYTGESITATATGTITDVGEVANTIEYEINGADAEKKYNVILKEGTLKITRIKIYYKTESATKIYDGTPLSNSNVTFTGVPSGYTIQVIRTSDITEAGSIPNELILCDVKVEATGQVLNSNLFEYVAEEIGTLTITKRKITIVTGSGEWVYDGMSHVKHESTISSDDNRLPATLIEYNYDHFTKLNDEFAYNTQITYLIEYDKFITYPGEELNTIKVNILHDGIDVSSNYEIDTTFGTLKVKAQDNPDEPDDPDDPNDDDSNTNLSGNITGSGNSGDANSEKKPQYEIFSEVTGSVYLRAESFGDWNGENGWLTPAIYKDNFTTDVNPLQYAYMAMGETAYSLEITKVAKGAPYVLPYYTDLGAETNYNDVVISKTSSYYQISFVPYDYNASNINELKGKLNGTAYQVFEEEYRNFVYNNYTALPTKTLSAMQEVISENGFNLSNPNVIYEIAEFVKNKVRYDFEFDYEGQDVASYFFNGATTGICQHYATAATALYRALGIPARYTVGITGDVKANEKVTIYSPYHAWVELYIDGFGWVPVEVTGAGSVNGGQIVEEELLNEIKVKPVDVVEEYVNSSTTVYAKQEIENADKKNARDGYQEYLDKGYRFEFIVSGSLQGRVGSVNEGESNIDELIMYSPDGEIVFSTKQAPELNVVNVILEKGSIKITPPHLTIKLYEVSKAYDGKPLSYEKDDFEIITTEFSEYDVEIEIFGELITPGKLTIEEIAENCTVTVRHKVTGQELVRNEDYYLNVTGNPLSVERREIAVITASGNAEYVEGTTFELKDAWVDRGSILTSQGHKLVVEFDGGLKDVGMAFNTLSKCQIVDGRGEDVTEYYKITLEYGVLIVT